MEPTRYQHYIDGEWRDSTSGKTIESENPGTGEVWALIPDGTTEDVDAAARAARRAFDDSDWATPQMGPERGEILRRIAKIMMDETDRLSEVESTDCGKPIMESSIVDVPMAAESYAFYADWAPHIGGKVIPVAAAALDFTVREAVGVCGAIVPWNFPLLIGSWKLAPALAAGCTVVLKPSEMTSASILELMSVFERAGVPKGVVNIVTGYGPTVGKAICEHEFVDKISFTGSTATGKEIVRIAAGTMKSTTTELGGKNPLIIFEDADLDKALASSMVGGCLNQGEACIASSRLLLHRSIHRRFVDRLVDRVERIQVGPPLDYDTRMGALISAAHLAKVEKYVAIGREEGAKLLSGGERPSSDELAGGYYYKPTIFDDVQPEMRIAREEIFGPVIAVMTFEHEAEALRMANDSIYGLSAGVFTSDVSRAIRVARRLKAGTVWVNSYGYLKTEAPCGGYKQSGTGRDLSEHALEHYTQLKNIYIDLEKEQICFYE